MAIVGAGPVGLFAAFYAGLRRMSVTLIDSLDLLGGQLATLYPEKYIYDAPGFPGVLAKDLARALIEQAMQYRPAVELGQEVRELNFDPQSRLYTIQTAKQDHRARAVLIAAGVGAFQPRTLPLPEARQYEGRGLYYFVTDPNQFRGRRVLIVGGGDSAVDWANALAPIAAEQTLIHRRDVFRAHEQSVEQMKRTKTRLLPFHELKSIGGTGRVESASVYDNRTGAEQTFETDAILVNIGFVSSLGPIKNWGLALEGGSVRVDAMMQTNRPGIFAAGDICAHPGKLKLIATGFGEAAVAVNFAKHYLDPSSPIFPGHSTDLKR